MTTPLFTPYGKTPRLFRDCVVTEKIDGTNAGIRITDDGAIFAQSRNRLITPDDDNHGFAAWVAEHAGVLTDVLGPGLHFGEWWGSGIGRGYDLPKGEKRLSLFNVKRWEDADDELGMVPGLGVVPVVWKGTFHTLHIQTALAHLKASGSMAAPGFMRPEGVVVFHSQAQQVFKVLAEADEYAKSQLVAVAA